MPSPDRDLDRARQNLANAFAAGATVADAFATVLAVVHGGRPHQHADRARELADLAGGRE